MCRAWITCTSSTAAVAFATSASTQQVFFGVVGSPSGLEGLPERVDGVLRRTEGKTLCLDVGVLDRQRENVGIQRPVFDETRLERVQLPDLIAIREFLEDPLQRLNVPLDRLRRLLGFASRGA